MFQPLLYQVLITCTLSCVIVTKDENHQRFRRSLERDIITTDRLKELRDEMVLLNLSALIIPLDEEGRLGWISGFSGSAGNSIVTLSKAALWTDGRYFLQAEDELDVNWTLMKRGEPGVLDETPWLTSQDGANLTSGDRVGIDSTLMNAESWLSMQKSLNLSGLQLLSLKTNPIDLIWTEEDGRPPFKPKNLVIHPIEFSGIDFETKIVELRNDIGQQGGVAMVVTELDQIAWLLNLRGKGDSLVESLMHSPTFQSMLLVYKTKVTLWAHGDSLSPEIMNYLNPSDCESNKTCVEIHDYTNRFNDLETWSIANLNETEKVLLSKQSVYLNGASYAVYECFAPNSIKFVDSPIIVKKAVKNDVEVNGMISSHIQDGVALAEFFSHLEEEMKNGEKWTEISASKLLESYRSKRPHFVGNSFTTISAYGPHASVVHYTPSSDSDIQIKNDSLYLVDSGGQYENGCTTDVTRTFHFGTPSSEQVEMYTRVLMGSIDLAQVSLPIRSLDVSIDLATRRYLFEKNLNYKHGTGHGIGSYLQVHEDPINVGMGGGRTTGKLLPNMFFSDEPGYYKDNDYGIRLETILRVVGKNNSDQGYGDFIHFEPVTLVPFETKLIDYSLMTNSQLEWLNDYNDLIRSKIGPILEEAGSDRALQWILARTDFDQSTKVKRSKH